jgi:hypothetical protein
MSTQQCSEKFGRMLGNASGASRSSALTETSIQRMGTQGGNHQRPTAKANPEKANDLGISASW